MMSALRRIPQLVQRLGRNMATSSARQAELRAEDTNAFKKLIKQREQFNSGMGPDEVFLQGGFSDILLYRTTVFGTIFGSLYSGKIIYDMAQK